LAERQFANDKLLGLNKVMEIIDDKKPISRKKLAKLAEKMFGNLVKAVVDIKKEKMAIDGELHSDEEALLLENGSKQSNLWGINLYPEIEGNDWVEFDSMINLRPKQNNRTRGIEDVKIRKKIIKIVSELTNE
jgi:hypothetical protein